MQVDVLAGRAGMVSRTSLGCPGFFDLIFDVGAVELPVKGSFDSRDSHRNNDPGGHESDQSHGHGQQSTAFALGSKIPVSNGCRCNADKIERLTQRPTLKPADEQTNRKNHHQEEGKQRPQQEQHEAKPLNEGQRQFQNPSWTIVKTAGCSSNRIKPSMAAGSSTPLFDKGTENR
jgi:hypothetical protein